MSPASSPPRPAARLPLVRPERDRVFAGVCSGIAHHLELPVGWVRLFFAGIAVAGGVGVIAYVFLWLIVPPGDPVLAARVQADPARARGAQPVDGGRGSRPAINGGAVLAADLRALMSRMPIRDVAFGLILLVIAAAILMSALGWSVPAGWLIPVLIVVAGALLAWSQLDSQARTRLVAGAGGKTPLGVVRLAGGFALVVVGLLLLVGQRVDASTVLSSAIAALAVLIGVALVAAPWWLRLVGELGRERAARERADERAEIAAHLHDSVLQTLAMIQRDSHDTATVARLARTQERELRSWLYQDKPREGTSVAAELAALVAAVEDEHSAAIETIAVGDAVPSVVSDALLAAAREALLNAVRHGAPPVTVYWEAGASGLEISIRDHGPGFDLAAIHDDRLGVRESIIGRIERRGGRVQIRQPSGGGTEVRMQIPDVTQEVHDDEQ